MNVCMFVDIALQGLELIWKTSISMILEEKNGSLEWLRNVTKIESEKRMMFNEK